MRNYAFTQLLYSKVSKDLWKHSLRVNTLCMMYSDDDLIYTASLLHDILEDTDCTYEELADIDKEVADIVLILTRQQSETYEEYIGRVKENETARIVKICDLLDHLASYKTLKPSLKKRYIKALGELLE